MDNFYVYSHIRPDTGAIFYIGKGSGYRSHIRQRKSKYWNRIVNKNNSEYIINYIAKNLTEQEAHDLEKKLIFQYGRVDLGTGILCNHTDGGEGLSGYIFSEETCQKRKLVKGSSHHMYGKKMSAESKEKMRQAKLGKPGVSLGRKVSDITKEKIRNSLKGRVTDRRGKPDITKRKVIINVLTNEIVAIGIADFIKYPLCKTKSISVLRNYFSGWKKKPIWFTFAYKY